MMQPLHLQSLKKILAALAILFLLGFSIITVDTGVNFIKGSDNSQAYETLVKIATPSDKQEGSLQNAEQIENHMVQAEAEITNSLYFKTIRKLSSVEYAYGQGSYIEQYIINNNKTLVEKRNFGLHMICGAICLLLGAFQFWPRFRRRYRKIHRVFGGIFIVSGVTLSISVWLYLIWSGPEKTYEGLTGQAGLYGLSCIVLLSMAISIFYLFKRDYNKHMGWMAIAFGSFLTAPFQRYDWMVLAVLDTGQSHAVINGLVDAVLYTQAYAVAYLLFFMNRHLSPIKSTPQSLNVKANVYTSTFKRYGLIALSTFGAISVFYYYVFTQGMADSNAVLQIIDEKAFIKETVVIFKQGFAAPLLFAVSSALIMCLGAYFIHKLNSVCRIGKPALYLFVLAGILLACIEISWGLQIGYPIMLNSPGGGHYVLWGILHLLFSSAVVYAYWANKQSLLKEWITMLWILSFLPVSVFCLATGVSVLNVVPQDYIDSRHLSVLLAAGASTFIFLLAMIAAIYGSATKERAIH
jgi:hypothetical protein